MNDPGRGTRMITTMTRLNLQSVKWEDGISEEQFLRRIVHSLQEQRESPRQYLLALRWNLTGQGDRPVPRMIEFWFDNNAFSWGRSRGGCRVKQPRFNKDKMLMLLASDEYQRLMRF